MTRSTDDASVFMCDSGEKVTMAFTAKNTVFLVVRSVGNEPNKVIPTADNTTGSFSFTVSASTNVAITASYSSQQGGSYDVSISDSHGTAFPDRIRQASSHPAFRTQTYTFAVR
jgi:phage tail sheath gpL-like